MAGVCASELLLALFAVVTGLRPNLALIVLGTFGMAFSLGLADGIVMTIIQTKVPQRLQGRVFAINLTIAAAAVPLAFAVIAPYGTRLLRPVVTASGPLGETVRAVVGTGSGRAIGLFYVVCGLALALLVIGARRTRVLARFDVTCRMLSPTTSWVSRRSDQALLMPPPPWSAPPAPVAPDPTSLERRVPEGDLTKK